MCNAYQFGCCTRSAVRPIGIDRLSRYSENARSIAIKKHEIETLNANENVTQRGYTQGYGYASLPYRSPSVGRHRRCLREQHGTIGIRA
jgi:hypothetical protein